MIAYTLYEWAMAALWVGVAAAAVIVAAFCIHVYRLISRK